MSDITVMSISRRSVKLFYQRRLAKLSGNRLETWPENPRTVSKYIQHAETDRSHN